MQTTLSQTPEPPIGVWKAPACGEAPIKRLGPIFSLAAASAPTTSLRDSLALGERDKELGPQPAMGRVPVRKRVPIGIKLDGREGNRRGQNLQAELRREGERRTDRDGQQHGQVRDDLARRMMVLAAQTDLATPPHPLDGLVLEAGPPSPGADQNMVGREIGRFVYRTRTLG